METRTIRFGLGEVICDVATAGESIPAVTLEPCVDEPGTVGKRGPDLPVDQLRSGSIVLEFHGAEGAKILIEDISRSLLKRGLNLSAWLDQLSWEIAASVEEPALSGDMYPYYGDHQVCDLEVGRELGDGLAGSLMAPSPLQKHLQEKS